MFPEEYLKKIPEDQHAAAEDVLSVLYETKKENKMGHSIADWGLMIADPKSEIRNPQSLYTGGIFNGEILEK